MNIIWTQENLPWCDLVEMGNRTGQEEMAFCFAYKTKPNSVDTMPLKS